MSSEHVQGIGKKAREKKGRNGSFVIFAEQSIVNFPEEKVQIITILLAHAVLFEQLHNCHLDDVSYFLVC